MMFGYATSETDNYMPLPLELAHTLLRELSAIRREGKVMTYLRPDAKSQVTIEYSDDHKRVPQREARSNRDVQAPALGSAPRM